MKGFYAESSYVGLMPDGTWQRFETEAAYKELYEEVLNGAG